MSILPAICRTQEWILSLERWAVFNEALFDELVEDYGPSFLMLFVIKLPSVNQTFLDQLVAFATKIDSPALTLLRVRDEASQI